MDRDRDAVHGWQDGRLEKERALVPGEQQVHRVQQVAAHGLHDIGLVRVTGVHQQQCEFLVGAHGRVGQDRLLLLGRDLARAIQQRGQFRRLPVKTGIDQFAFAEKQFGGGGG